MSEEWCVIADFPHYAVSNMGRIKRIMPDRYGRMNGRIMQPKATKGGYLQCGLTCGDKRHTILINRVVCAAFNGPAPTPSHHAAHRDGDRRNNHADNLRWATPSENEYDKRAHGTLRAGIKHHSATRPECVARGSRIGTSKLTEDAILSIRKDTRSRSEISAIYDITKSHVSDIRSRKVWRHVR